jgi:predicted RNA-binding Zn-ribbon protein involved in translation (DUF1610 family)
MTMKQYAMNLRLFQQKFQTESACQQHLFSIRWPDGFCCPKCGHQEYYKISKPLLFQCKVWPLGLFVGEILGVIVGEN